MYSISICGVGIFSQINNFRWFFSSSSISWDEAVPGASTLGQSGLGSTSYKGVLTESSNIHKWIFNVTCRTTIFFFFFFGGGLPTTLQGIHSAYSKTRQPDNTSRGYGGCGESPILTISTRFIAPSAGFRISKLYLLLRVGSPTQKNGISLQLEI